MEIINFIDIVRLVPSITTILHNLLLGCISPLCRCGLYLQMEQCGLSVCWSLSLSQLQAL